jgi:hypothetical protein
VLKAEDAQRHEIQSLPGLHQDSTCVASPAGEGENVVSRRGHRRVGAVIAAALLAVLLSACTWMDADRGRSSDHDPPGGEESWDPDLEDGIDDS